MFNSKQYQDKSKKKSWTHFAGLCKSCGLCVEICPMKCLSLNNERLTVNGLPSIKNDIEKCVLCKKCENICPDCAIKVK